MCIMEICSQRSAARDRVERTKFTTARLFPTLCLSPFVCVFFPDALFKKYQTIFFCCKRKKEKKSLITVGSPLLNAALVDDLHLIAVHMTLDSLSQGVCFSCTEGK